MMVPAHTHQQGSGGPIAEVDRETFLKVLKKLERPMVVSVRSGWPKSYKYVTQYAGFYFRLKSKEPHDFSRQAEVIEVDKVRSSNDSMAW